MKGTTKRIKPDKDWGFLRGEDGEDYFLHRRDFNGFWDDLVEDSQTEKINVEFSPEDSPRGPRAMNAKRMDFPNAAA
jgi:cold shock CspA family protein